MPQYVLTGQNANDPTYLQIVTDADDLLTSMEPPFYRASDAIMKRLLEAWQQYADASGSPSTAQTLGQFKEWLTQTYPPDENGLVPYRVVQVGA